MGNKHGKGALKERDLREYQSMCQLERDEIEMLYAQFMAMRASDTNDVLINQTEFQRALGFSDGQSSLFVERIFHLFDENGDGYVNFPEFIRGFSKLTPHGTHEQKLNCMSSRRVSSSHSNRGTLCFGLQSRSTSTIPMETGKFHRKIFGGYYKVALMRMDCISRPLMYRKW
eukprot:gb/GECG01015670.1/.p1 GENE.gb/GECG01015670.1/~~gb/GECG01015670.1/.p1  ORF type:complete len:172 (+),score=19.11 gb/GECG01015670.1/:1-516(+)